jgi:DNA-binding response OmpR family regulator
MIIKIILLTDSAQINVLIKQILNPDKFKIYKLNPDNISLIQNINTIKPDYIILVNSIDKYNTYDLYNNLIEKTSILPDNVIILYKNLVNPDKLKGVNKFLKTPFNPDDLLKFFSYDVLKKNILFIDDTKLYHKMYVPELLKNNFNVYEAWTGEEGIKILYNNKIDLVISDIEMPGINGYKVCKLIKLDPIKKSIPVILLSTLSSDESLEQGFFAGADDYVIKSVTKSDLLNKVEKNLNTTLLIREEHILIVDDSVTIRNILRQTLSSHGFYLIDESTNGEEALELLKKNNYQLIITDYAMPKMNGYDFCVKVKSEQEYINIPIIVLSGINRDANIFKFRALGINSFLLQPFDSYRLLAEIEKILIEKQQEKQKEYVKSYLSNYTMQAIDSYIDFNKADTFAMKKSLTIMFTDLVSFTTLSEKCSPEKVVEILNNYFEKMVPIVIKYGGTIDKFMGDAILAIFDEKEKGALNAVKTGKEMLTELKNLNNELDIDLHIRVGVNYGEVIIGDIGSKKHRREYTIIGDHVNIANRVETIADTDSMYITENVYSLVKDHIKVSNTKLLTLKGKTEKVKVYKVE